jgi:hypothetical protein
MVLQTSLAAAQCKQGRKAYAPTGTFVSLSGPAPGAGAESSVGQVNGFRRKSQIAAQHPRWTPCPSTCHMPTRGFI